MKHSELFNLNGKTAIVTGGANGIGKVSCEILAAAGVKMVVRRLPLIVMSQKMKRLLI